LIKQYPDDLDEINKLIEEDQAAEEEAKQ